MKEIYIFSGLGVDERVFKNINFGDFKPVFIKWIIPFKNEKIENYSKRLSEQILTENPVLIGLSFGGMIAIEVSKLLETEKIILIASAKTKNEIPFYYRFLGQLKIHKLIPMYLLRTGNLMTHWFFGIKTEQEKLLFKAILKDTNPDFLIWALDKIVQWKNKNYPEKLIHIHGTNDRVLPFYFISSNIEVQGGGHFMTVNKSVELSKILRELLTN